MKTRLHTILTVAGIAAAGAASAQSAITITDTGYPTAFPTIDTAKIVSNLSAFSSLGVAASNQDWDASTATYSGPTYYDRLTPTNTAFPNATYRGNLYTTFASGLQYVTSGYYTRSGSGIARIGEEVRTRQAISLGAVSGNNGDSVIFPVQTITYTGGSTPELVFPATINSRWSSSVGSTLLFNVTYAPFFNNAPGERRILRTANDTVVGWGRMRVMTDAGQPSGWMNVLQVRSSASIRDSFYLNGTPAPPLVLSQLSLQQGQITNVTYVKFYRASEYTALADLVWNAATSAGAPSRMYVSQMRLASPTSVGSVDKADAVRLFPNPVRNGGQVQVSLPVGEDFRYQMLSVTGAVVSEGSLKASGAGNAQLSLPTNTAAGIYYLVLNSASTGRLVLPFDVE